MAALDFPASPTDGQQFVAPNGVTYSYSAAYTAWVVVGSAGAYIGVSPPSTPYVGQFWYNTELGTTFVWYNDGNSTQWVPASPPVLSSLPMSWRLLERKVPTAGQVNVDFLSIPADINDLMFSFDVTPTANAQGFTLAFFDQTNTLLTTGYYFGNSMSYHSQGVGAAPQVATSTSWGLNYAFILHWSNSTRNVSNSATIGGITGRGMVESIRETTRPKGCDWQSKHLADQGDIILFTAGNGQRQLAGAVGGLRFSWGNTGATYAAGGSISLWGSP